MNTIAAPISTSTPSKISTARQPMRSPITPDSDAPSRLPDIDPIRLRLSASWRPFKGTRSPVRLIATGNVPPAPTPQKMRVTSNSE